MTDSSVLNGEQVFVARQPIFDAAKSVYAYELLFRTSHENKFTPIDGDLASFHTINNALHLMGLDTLIGHSRAFINFTRRLLLDEAYTLLPANRVVVELLETVEPDPEVIRACETLKERGYLLALDDFVFAPEFEPLMRLADIIKVDFMLSSVAERAHIVETANKHNCLLLAEKIDSPEALQEAIEAGYAYFQGYFFCKPEIVTGKNLRSSKLIYLQFLAEINKPNVEFDQLEKVIQRDVSLSYKLLRYLNSAEVGLGNKVSSIKQALVLLGHEPLRKWGSFVGLTGLGEDKPHELLKTCLVRARFCELAGSRLKLTDPGSLFVMGLLSGLNAVMDRPMREVLEEVPLEDSIKQALLGHRTAMGHLYQSVRAFETGAWERIMTHSEKLGIALHESAGDYRSAIQWAENVIGSTASPTSNAA